MCMLDRIRCQYRFDSVVQLSIMLILISSAAVAAPAITDVTQSASTLTMTGSGFGTKSMALPLKYTNFDSDTDIIGSVPPGWATSTPNPSLVSGAIAHSGGKALDSSAVNRTSDFFPRVSWDLGTTIPLGGTLYLSFWMYLDKTGTTATGWDWKAPLITSSNTPYYWGPLSATRNASIGFAGFYDVALSKWYNTAATIQYSKDGIGNNFNYCAPTPTTNAWTNRWASDAFVYTGWQRVDWVFKPSSAPGVNDGSVLVTRIGKSVPALSATQCVTHGNTSDLWRYVSIPQGINVITGGALNLKMYFDDIYIDNTLARVEICDASTWSSSTHCEIQPPTAWAVDKITVNFNRGSFTDGQKVYVYVVDSSGVVNSDGYKFSIGAPAAPKNVTKVPVTN